MSVYIGILTFSLILLVPLMLWGSRPSWWTVIGCTLYAVAYLVSNAFHLAFYVLEPLPPEYAEAWAMAMDGAPPSAYGFAIRIYTASSLLLVVVYCFTTFFAISRQDLQARLAWLVLAVAEAFAFLEYCNCKLLVSPFGAEDLHLSTVWGIEVSRYACGRLFANWSPFLPPIVTSVYLVWINSQKRFRGHC